MTPTKVVNRLVEVGPVILEQFTKSPSHCILATAIGVKVLQAFAIDARALSVRCVVANKAWLMGVKQTETGSKPDWDRMRAAGAWMLDTGNPDDPQAGSWDERGWYGHLVIWLPNVNGGALVDLTLGQMNRPAKMIRVPAAASFHFQPPTVTYTLPDDLQLAFTARPDDTSYHVSKDWTDPRRHDDLVQLLVRVIRKGRP